jgi:hypothetical protein
LFTRPPRRFILAEAENEKEPKSDVSDFGQSIIADPGKPRVRMRKPAGFLDSPLAGNGLAADDDPAAMAPDLPAMAVMTMPAVTVPAPVRTEIGALRVLMRDLHAAAHDVGIGSDGRRGKGHADAGSENESKLFHFSCSSLSIVQTRPCLLNSTGIQAVP